MWTKNVLMFTVLLFSVIKDVEGVKRTTRPCRWSDIEFCERFLATYVGNPSNWHEDKDKKNILYCDFVKLRLNCLESLNCDADDTPNSRMPLNITLWKQMLAPDLENMINLDLCADKPRNLIKSDRSDPCSEYSVVKRCMDELSDYLKSSYSMTCVAMLKADRCFINESARCRRQRTFDTPPLPRHLQFQNPYRIIAHLGRCRLIWNPNLYGRQEQWRIRHSKDYFSYF
ncbi:uncharacterized protein [Ptychodera flava]|uniref:uncharacterized protein n=1 Tax=Ptychodera flava TaxID=63121 RepID=UPI00396A88FF